MQWAGFSNEFTVILVFIKFRTGALHFRFALNKNYITLNGTFNAYGIQLPSPTANFLRSQIESIRNINSKMVH